MIVEIVSTGTELLLGEIADTNAQYLSSRLNELGYNVLYRTTVGDNEQRMKFVLEIAAQRADIIITTGGLGPTQGDITKEVTASFCGREMYLDERSLSRIEHFFSKRDLCMPTSNSKQAMFACGSLVLDNDYGTAPAMLLEDKGRTFINLPGPPREMRGVFEEQVVPYLLEKYGSQGIIFSRTLRSIGLGESAIADCLADLIRGQSNPTIALYARSGEILIRLTAKADNQTNAQSLISGLEEQVRIRLGEYIFAADDETLQSAVGKLLIDKGLSLSLAESCTAGMLSSMLADVPGSSKYLRGSIVSYANEVKIAELGVNPLDLAQHGAVSECVAKQMARGVQNRLGTDIGVGITGIAGPEGGSAEKPVGLVYIATAYRDKIICRKNIFIGNRKTVRLRAAKIALAELLKIVNN